MFLMPGTTQGPCKEMLLPCFINLEDVLRIFSGDIAENEKIMFSQQRLSRRDFNKQVVKEDVALWRKQIIKM